MTRQLTAIIEREGDGYVSRCPDLDVASQGATANEARENLQEALTLFFETASPTEIDRRLHNEVYVTGRDRAAACLHVVARSGQSQASLISPGCGSSPASRSVTARRHTAAV